MSLNENPHEDSRNEKLKNCLHLINGQSKDDNAIFCVLEKSYEQWIHQGSLQNFRFI